jgi:CBS domain-containing protein
MRIVDMMKHEPSATTPTASLAEAGRLMAAIGCGILPVIDERYRVVGVITDRDICLALANADVPASRLQVSAAMSVPAYSCRAEDDVESALNTLGHHRIRRLPVVDAGERLAGMFSLDDAALRYTEATPRAAHALSIANALRAVCSPAVPALG